MSTLNHSIREELLHCVEHERQEAENHNPLFFSLHPATGAMQGLEMQNLHEHATVISCQSIKNIVITGR